MSTIANPAITRTGESSEKKLSVFKRFLNWSEAQQKNHFLWLGIALAGHGCAFTPITIYIVYLAGMNFGLFMIALIVMTLTLIANLAALPTKITIPVLLTSVIVDLLVIASAIGILLNNA